jgi:DNA-binding SARP family transcriptional activator
MDVSLVWPVVTSEQNWRIMQVNIAVQLFGRLSVRRGVDEVTMGSERQRAIFALLVLANGQPVSRGELVHALWGDEPPTYASNIIQTYVKRLRQSLEPDRLARRPSALLHQVASGYRLNIESDQVDALRLRHLLQSARVARRTAHADALAALLEPALDLATAPIVADVPMLADHPRVEAVGADQARVAEWYAEAALRQGCAADALPVLAQSAARRPYDESAYGWLIRTYSAMGRRADALVAYDRIRRRLNDELGIDPGRALRALRDSILRDESLAELRA